MKEQNIQTLISLELSKKQNVRVFRNNTGVGYVGEIIHKDAKSITLANWRPLHAGLCQGSSDLIGIETVQITAEMVGMSIGKFVAIEVKTPFGRATKEQLAFISFVNKRGGKAEVVRSVEEAKLKFL